MWSGISFAGPRRQKNAGALTLFAAVLVALGCAGRSTSALPSDDDDDHASNSGRGGKGGGGGKAGRGGSAGRAAGSGGMAGTGGTDVPYMDPGCPDLPAPAPVLECDVFSTPSGCPDGMACKPYIDHPYGSGCDQQSFNMLCVYAGSGEQGDPCDSGMSDCAEGHICVVGAAHGPHCLRMCPLDGTITCPSGFVCGATDAEGIGVCA
jgi:hypothetical protein